jgi:hypothetical protein
MSTGMMSASEIDAMEQNMRMQYLGNGIYPGVAMFAGEVLAGKVCSA